MTTKDHKLTAGEKSFWKDAFIASASGRLAALLPEDAKQCADFADEALRIYRDRIIWRKGNE
jgi:hypothetical protein